MNFTAALFYKCIEIWYSTIYRNKLIRIRTYSSILLLMESYWLCPKLKSWYAIGNSVSTPQFLSIYRLSGENGKLLALLIFYPRQEYHFSVCVVIANHLLENSASFPWALPRMSPTPSSYGKGVSRTLSHVVAQTPPPPYYSYHYNFRFIFVNVHVQFVQYSPLCLHNISKEAVWVRSDQPFCISYIFPLIMLADVIFIQF